jgi:hypothetical protein
VGNCLRPADRCWRACLRPNYFSGARPPARADLSSCRNSQRTRDCTCTSTLLTACKAFVNHSFFFSLQKPKPHEEFHVHIQAAVLSAISHHVLCDYVNESMVRDPNRILAAIRGVTMTQGLFGGTVDEDNRTIYIEHFYACHR